MRIKTRRPAERAISVLNPLIVVIVVMAIITGSSLSVRSVLAATVWNVSVGSPGACTVGDPNCAAIGAAVAASSSGDTIIVAAGTYNEHDITIDHDLIINGASSATTILDALQLGRVFNIAAGTVSISGLRITNGRTANGKDCDPPTDGEEGGGILNDGNLSLANCLIDHNRTGNGGNGNAFDSFGGFGGSGGGIYNSFLGSLTITNCVVSNNVTGNSGQSGNGFGSGSGGEGGGVYSEGILNIASSTITSNTTGNGSGGAAGNTFAGDGGNGGGIFNCGFAGGTTITNSTISDNTTGKGGVSSYSGFGGEGGGIYNVNSVSLEITNCTINNNQTGDGGGPLTAGGRGGGIWNIGLLTVRNSTVAFNVTGNGGPSGYGGDGGGIHSEAFDTITVTNSTIAGNRTGTGSVCGCGSNGGGVNLDPFGSDGVFNSVIIAGNSVGAGGSGPDVFGCTYISEGYNVVGKTDGSTGSPGFTEPTDQTGTIAAPLDAKLDPGGLQANGGPTKTIRLLFGSPALDKGISNSLTTDQRGAGFPRTFDAPTFANAAGGDGTDVGAFEAQGNSCLPDLSPPSITCPGSITKFTDSGQLSAIVNPGVPAASDSCGAQIVGSRSDGKPLNQPFPVGLTLLTWTATNSSGQQASCGQTIIVMVPSSRRPGP